MTQTSTERRGSPGRSSNWLWMVTSIAIVVGFMIWLGANSQPSEVVVVEEEAEEAVAVPSEAVTVELSDFAASVDDFVGQMVRLDGIQVASRLGNEAFWTAPPGGIPVLVKLSPALVADGFSVESGETLTVVGQVVAMSDSVLSAWEASGALQGEAQRAEASFATGYLEAVLATKAAASSDEG